MEQTIKMFKYIDPDLVLKKYLGIKVKLVTYFGALLTAFWIYNENVSFPLFLICFYFGIFYARIGIDIGFHRYFSHRSFKTSNFKKKLLLFWGSSIGVGSCLTYAGVHRTHHRHTDTNKDPHSPKNIGIFRVWFTLWDDNWSIDPSMVKDLIRDKTQMFFHRNYFKLLTVWLVFLFLVSIAVGTLLPIVLLFGLPSALTILSSGITNGLGHSPKFGYQSFETQDQSRNLHLHRFSLLANGLHNNHHAKPESWTHNLNNKWYEFDLEAIIIKYFFKQQVGVN